MVRPPTVILNGGPNSPTVRTAVKDLLLTFAVNELLP